MEKYRLNLAIAKYCFTMALILISFALVMAQIS